MNPPSPADTDLLFPGSVATYSIKDLAEVLIKANDLHEGLYEVLLKIDITVGVFNMVAGQMPSPGVMSAISAVGLIKAAEQSPLSVDAAIVNPAKPKRAPRKTAA